ncbi:MAG: hypothetical protein HYZ37_18950 [Candidatus Solibacter usitatus]|nr:hypothetical protein [Candidatus Solibacter usitatus]
MCFTRILVCALLSAALVFSQGTTTPKKDAKAAKDSKAPAKKAAAAAKAKSAADQCQAMTQDGDQCKRKAAAGSKFCWQHGTKKESKTKKKT